MVASVIISQPPSKERSGLSMVMTCTAESFLQLGHLPFFSILSEFSPAQSLETSLQRMRNSVSIV